MLARGDYFADLSVVTLFDGLDLLGSGGILIIDNGLLDPDDARVGGVVSAGGLCRNTQAGRYPSDQ